MFNFLKKKKEETEEKEAENKEEKKPADKSPSPDASSTGSSADVTKVSTELDRVKASVESLGEARKSMTERMSRTSEQIGELRSMIMERDKSIREIELKAVKAADLVESVQPEKLMAEVKRVDAKFEALKANLESHEAIMDRIMEELKEARRKMEFFRGVDEIVKLSEEVKKELIEIKKVEANINVGTDKTQTFYSEIKKRFKDIDAFQDSIQELKVNLDQAMKDVSYLKTKTSNLAEKEEIEALTSKMQKHIGSLKELSRKSTMSKDLADLKKLLDNFG